MIYPRLDSSVFARLMSAWSLLKQEFPRDRNDVTHRSCAIFKCEVSHTNKQIAIDFLGVLRDPLEYD